MDVTMLILSSAITFRSLLLSADSLFETWVIEGNNPLKLLSTPARRVNDRQAQLTADLICQNHLLFSVLCLRHSCVTKVLRMSRCARGEYYPSIPVYVLTCWRTRSYKICQNQSNAPLWAGRAGSWLGPLADAYYAIQTFLLLTPHTPPAPPVGDSPPPLPIYCNEQFFS